MSIRTSERLLFKEAGRSLLKNRSYIALLSLLILLTSFMYFFVQFSIDNNRDTLRRIMRSGATLTEAQADLLAALEANTSLAWTFLLCFLAMSAFATFLFYRHYFGRHQREIGGFKALGFSNRVIVRTYAACTLILSTAASLTGALLGWIFSGVLLNAYTASYGIVDVEKGIHAVSLFYGVVLVISVLCAATVWSCATFGKKETALLIGDSDTSKENRTVNRIADKLSSIWPESRRISVRIALRKPVTCVLSLISVGVSMSLFMMSISLYMSSDKVYRSQTEGHHYAYDVRLDEIVQDDLGKSARSDLYLKVPASIQLSGAREPIQQHIVGLSGSGGGNMLELHDRNKERLTVPEDNGIWIGPALEEVYGLQKGDTITLAISGEPYSAVIAGVAENAESNSIYIAKKLLTNWLGLPETSYNGYWSNELESSIPGQVTARADRLAALDKEVVSNRMSAVINQLLGCVAGLILIYLVLLLNFQDSKKEMLVLGLLGYRPKEINNMLISVYRPVMTLAFLLMLFPSIALCKEIHRSLSIQTGDYIPFQTNIGIILGLFIGIQLIYWIVEKAFAAKIGKIVRREAVFNSL